MSDPESKARHRRRRRNKWARELEKRQYQPRQERSRKKEFYDVKPPSKQQLEEEIYGEDKEEA